MGIAFSQEGPPPFISVLDEACSPGGFPAILYDAADGFGLVSHNDFHGPGESGSVYHQYSFEAANSGAVITLEDDVLCLTGTAVGGVPSGDTTFTYCCTDVSGTPPSPIEANSCSGNYTHEPTGTTVPLTGKGRAGDNVELAIYEKYGIVRGEGWYMFPIGFDLQATGAGDFVFKIGCGPICGNGIQEGDEFCDDGDNDDTNECRNDCTACGDGETQEEYGETCDEGDQNGVGFCSETCSFCGDGVTQEDEGCDFEDPDAPEGCRDDCTYCGDGELQEEYGETCDYNADNGDIECRGQDGSVDEFDCTYCGDNVVDIPLETCDGGPDCDPNCGQSQQPECTEQFDGLTCGVFNLVDGPHGHGIFARGSFWPGNDYDPRSFTGGLFNYCPENELFFEGTFDNQGTECDITYGCAVVGPSTPNSNGGSEVQANDCEGTMTCDDVTIAIEGKSNGVTETSCYNKYATDPFQCISWFTFSDGAGGAIQGDLVWSGECPEDLIIQLP